MTIERIWPEVNHRVSYPIKRYVNWMEVNDLLDLGDEVTKFCVSFVLMGVCQVGPNRFIESLNAHPLSGEILYVSVSNSAACLFADNL